ncbi:hypothetical protein VIM7927_01310 [Vibrio mangrovi]|uniref:Uncharacterized protein n=1 Tax=Vibrio mangrovi TaxID=474394 RepID=A0A1Y6IQY8_9VIBR|nr:hypothetical protein VIM7927_01310 [Vibrio mangrovi]
MMEYTSLIAFTFAAVLLNLSPGPDSFCRIFSLGSIAGESDCAGDRITD